MTFIKKQWTRFKVWLIHKLGGQAEGDVGYRIWHNLTIPVRASIVLRSEELAFLSADEILKMLAREICSNPDFLRSIHVKAHEDVFTFGTVVEGTIVVESDGRNVVGGMQNDK